MKTYNQMQCNINNYIKMKNIVPNAMRYTTTLKYHMVWFGFVWWNIGWELKIY